MRHPPNVAPAREIFGLDLQREQEDRKNMRRENSTPMPLHVKNCSRAILKFLVLLLGRNLHAQACSLL